jgi:hypothetical protein
MPVESIEAGACAKRATRRGKRSRRLRDSREATQQFGIDRATIVFRFPDGWTVRRLGDATDLDREGMQMRNCLTGAYDYATYGETVYSLRDPGNIPHATMRVLHGLATIADAKANTQLKQEYADRIRTWLRAVPGDAAPFDGLLPYLVRLTESWVGSVVMSLPPDEQADFERALENDTEGHFYVDQLNATFNSLSAEEIADLEKEDLAVVSHHEILRRAVAKRPCAVVRFPRTTGGIAVEICAPEVATAEAIHHVEAARDAS